MFDINDDIPVGIDLGTTNSCIGYWDGFEVIIVPNRIGEKTTPSVVYLYKDEFIIGENIQKDLNLLNNSEKIYSLKRIIGQDYNDIPQNELNDLHYNIVEDKKSNKPLIKLIIKGQEKFFTPEELCSLILKKLIADVEKVVSAKIRKVVISVPAYFDDAQRSATIEAAEMAGVKVIRIINEPTAAALSYGLGENFCPILKKNSCFSDIFKKNRDIRQSQNEEIKIHQSNNNNNINNNSKKIKVKNSYRLFNDDEEDNKEDNEENKEEEEKGKNILVFDLGGGTFDLAILKLNSTHKEYEVKSKYSDKHLGGDDFDNKLANYCLNNCGFDIEFDNIDKKSKERLKKACEDAKKLLNKERLKENDDDSEDEREEKDVDVNIPIRLDNFIKGNDLIVPLTKKQFEEEICKEEFDRLKGHFDELLNGAKLTRKDIDEIILVGGSTKMHKIKKIIREEGFTCKIIDYINPDEVVAHGATIQAAMLMTLGRKDNNLKDIVLYDITPISLGTDVINNDENPKIKALGNKMSIIIPKWTPIPTSKMKPYKTVKDNQDSFQISIFEGENDYLKYNKKLGQFNLINLPLKPRGEVECEVYFEIDINNILTVKAFEKTGNNSEIKVINKNKIQNNSKNPYLNYSEFKELKKGHKNKVDALIKLYKKQKKNEDKIKYLLKYNDYIKENELNLINPDENENDINEKNIEKYFFYIYQLLESIEEILYLNEDKKLEEKLLDEIKKYINILKKQSPYYIREIIGLFKSSERVIFLTVFYYSIKALNESGSYYLEHLQKMSRYYAKLYFEEVFKLYKKYIENEDILYDDIKNDIDKEKENSEKNLQNINSNAILLISDSKKEGKLIDLQISNERMNEMLNLIKNWETGFTYLKNKINPEKKILENDDYNLILDELYKIMNELIVELNNLKENENDIERIRQLREEKGICCGNIVKIKFKYQKGTSYDKYLKLLKDSQICAQLCGKNNNQCIWYKEVLDLEKEIESKLNDDEQEIKDEISDDLEQIQNCSADKQRFVDFILQNHPYDGYNANTRPSDYFWDKVGRDITLFEFLKKKYNPDCYPKRTKEEKKKYYIRVKISQIINNYIHELED